MFLVLPWTVCNYSIQLINRITCNGIHFYYRSLLPTSWATSSKGYNVRVFLIPDQRNCATSCEFLDFTVMELKSLYLWDMEPHCCVLCAYFSRQHGGLFLKGQNVHFFTIHFDCWRWDHHAVWKHQAAVTHCPETMSQKKGDLL